jgi:hypothetical protein
MLITPIQTSNFNHHGHHLFKLYLLKLHSGFPHSVFYYFLDLKLYKNELEISSLNKRGPYNKPARSYTNKRAKQNFAHPSLHASIRLHVALCRSRLRKIDRWSISYGR